MPQMNWADFISAFGLLLLAELGDKTQLAVLTQVCKHRTVLPVFLGGSLALTILTGIGVAFGQAMGVLLPAAIIRRVAAVLFIAMGLYLAYQHLRQAGQPEETDESLVCDADNADQSAALRRRDWVAFSSTFVLIFLAELGDKTQLASISLASKSSSPWMVFLGASLALSTVTAMGVLFGQGISRLVPERILRLLSAAAFIILGVLIWFGVL
ncbi:MAG: TMEM165/GDT1 family protein [Anaerolineae bacterium]|nr:TMEM165/GDT1 family protein [Anaerolineae bacterium]